MKRDNFTLIHTTDGAPKFNNEAQVLTSSTGRMVAYGQMTHDEARRRRQSPDGSIDCGH